MRNFIGVLASLAVVAGFVSAGSAMVPCSAVYPGEQICLVR